VLEIVMFFERCKNGLRDCYRRAFVRSPIKVGYHSHLLARECIGSNLVKLCDSKGGESNDEDREKEWKEASFTPPLSSFRFPGSIFRPFLLS
jgi:hypothetical protein